ncbi:hypothetical protein Efla_004670 [Eimeria flavescens]
MGTFWSPHFHQPSSQDVMSHYDRISVTCTEDLLADFSSNSGAMSAADACQSVLTSTWALVPSSCQRQREAAASSQTADSHTADERMLGGWAHQPASHLAHNLARGACDIDTDCQHQSKCSHAGSMHGTTAETAWGTVYSTKNQGSCELSAESEALAERDSERTPPKSIQILALYYEPTTRMLAAASGVQIRKLSRKAFTPNAGASLLRAASAHQLHGFSFFDEESATRSKSSPLQALSADDQTTRTCRLTRFTLIPLQRAALGRDVPSKLALVGTAKAATGQPQTVFEMLDAFTSTSAGSKAG